ncbi:hypothetical protein ANCCAN_03939 [Ancylostoma caninum]|uniref:Uncharacterized protein n=1 Tax=Ancylostoma caninum TaxID=29170 RepID=A0A368GZY6_ANCCA|nr:hypothetical protein ANCCAN_03939 [Ancylostoma caninum]
MDVPYVPLSNMVEPRRSEYSSPKLRQTSEKDTSKSSCVSQCKPSSPSSSPASERVTSTSAQISDQRSQFLHEPATTKQDFFFKRSRPVQFIGPQLNSFPDLRIELVPFVDYLLYN